MRLKGQRSPGQTKRVAQRSREEADPWLEPRVGRVEAETEVPEGGKARPGVHGAPPPQLAGGAADEDVVARGVDHPVVALPRVVVVPGYLDEALVEAQVVSDGVLPPLLVGFEVREAFHDEFVNSIESESLLRAFSDCHHYQCIVAKWRFF